MVVNWTVKLMTIALMKNPWIFNLVDKYIGEEIPAPECKGIECNKWKKGKKAIQDS